jgi:diguanylate cyclase
MSDILEIVVYVVLAGGCVAALLAGIVLLLWRRKRTAVSAATPAALLTPAFQKTPAASAKETNMPDSTRHDAEVLERSKVIVHGLMLEISERVQKLIGDASNYGDQLEAHGAGVRKAMTQAALEEIERQLLREIDSMREVNAAYHQQLEAAQIKIEEQQHQLDKLTEDATVDFLTQAPNRRFFDQRLREEFLRFKRHGQPFSLVLIDIDFFKSVNDTYGHLAGDRVLRAVAELLSTSLRESDAFARFGGEEFAMLLPETDVHQGRVVAQKARKRIENARFNYEGTTMQITLSAGVAQSAMFDTEALDVIERADAALYRAKEGGRNRVEITLPDLPGAPEE